jgi:hypothetical protein
LSERRKPKRKSPFDFFGFDEDLFSFGDQFKSARGKEGGSGYSISVSYDEKGKPVVKVQTYGQVDMADLREDILRRYPGATIEGLEKQPLIRVVGENQQEPPERKREEKKKEKKSSTSIRIVE